MKQTVLAIIGPTASGKSKFGMALAEQLQGEIISCDSVQVYKDFDLGSAKPSREEQEEIPHHLIDVVSWKETFDAARYRELALQTIADIQSRKKTPIIVGGTGLYFRALCGDQFHDLPSDPSLRKELESWSLEQLRQKLNALDPERSQQIHDNDRFRLSRACEITMLTGMTLKELAQLKSTQALQPFTMLCNPPREALLKNIEARSELMLTQGLIDEVRKLKNQGCPPSAKPMQSIGYKQVCDFLDGHIKEEDLLEKIVIATRQYARKQMMWFRKTPVDRELKDLSHCSETLKIILKSFQK